MIVEPEILEAMVKAAAEKGEPNGNKTGNKPTHPERTAPTCANAASKPSSPNRLTKPATARNAVRKAAGPSLVTNSSTNSATASSEPVNKTKDWRGLAVRYDKRPDSYQAGIDLCAGLRWIRHLGAQP